MNWIFTARHAFFVIDWPKSWERFYLKHDLLNRDPLLPAVEFYRRPFSWTELKKDIRISADGQAVLREAGERGWHNGLVVPISRGYSNRFGLVSIVGKEPVITAKTAPFLALLSTCFFEHVKSLVPSNGFAAPPANLSPREIDCTRLVALGFSDKRIAQKLEISVSTSHDYVEAAKAKLRVRNRPQLASVASALSLIPY